MKMMSILTGTTNFMTKFSGFKSALAALALIPAMTACVEMNDSMGDGYIPEDQNYTVKHISKEIPVQLRNPDSLQAANLRSIAVGSIRNENLGTTNVGSVLNFYPTLTGLRFGKNPIAEKLYIRFEKHDEGNFCTDEFYETAPQNLHLHVLNREIDSTLAYFDSLKPEDYDNDPLCSIVYFGDDTINVNLPLDYAEELFSATEAELDSSTVFVKRFKGFYLSCDEYAGAAPGGRINNFNKQASAYFRYSFEHSESGERIDTMIVFTVGSTAVNAGASESSALETEKTGTTMTAEGLGGIKPYISYADIKGIMEQIAEDEGTGIENIIISRARFIFPYDEIQDYDLINLFPERIYPNYAYKYDNTGFKQYYTFPEMTRQDIRNGSIIREKYRYECDLTDEVSHIKNTAHEDLDESDNLWIMPSILTENSYDQEVGYTDNSIYSFFILNGNESENPPRIEITYIVLQ